MSNEEEQSLDELDAECRVLMSEKIKRLKLEQEKFEKEEADKAFAARLAEEVKKELALKEEARKLEEDEKREQGNVSINIPGNGVGTADVFDEPEPKKIPEQKNATVLKRVEQLYKNFNKKSGIDLKVDEIQPYSAADLNSSGANIEYPNGFAFTDSDDGCSYVIDSWSPADTWCNAIWYAVQCKQMLAGRVTVRACDIAKGQGNVVQFRTITADTFPSALTACECASCGSNTLSTHSLTLARYDLYKVICGLDEWDVGEVLPIAAAQTMVNSFATGIDSLIYTALRDATPTYSETSGVSFSCSPAMGGGSCCSYGQDLYKEIIELEAKMRTAGYFNDVDPILIISPRMALFLKYKEGINPPPWVNNIVMDGNKLSRIGDIEVIEYCGATACTDNDDEPVAILIDPSRAVGEAYGKKPHLITDNDPIECDSQKFVYRMYIAIGALESAAIGHILNP